MASWWLQVRDFLGHDEGEGLLGYVVLTFLLAVVVVLGCDALDVSPTAALRGINSLAGRLLAAYL